MERLEIKREAGSGNLWLKRHADAEMDAEMGTEGVRPSAKALGKRKAVNVDAKEVKRFFVSLSSSAFTLLILNPNNRDNRVIPMPSQRLSRSRMSASKQIRRRPDNFRLPPLRPPNLLAQPFLRAPHLPSSPYHGVPLVTRRSLDNTISQTSLLCHPHHLDLSSHSIASSPLELSSLMTTGSSKVARWTLRKTVGFDSHRTC